MNNRSKFNLRKQAMNIMQLMSFLEKSRKFGITERGGVSAVIRLKGSMKRLCKEIWELINICKDQPV